MCGILGYIGHKTISEILLNGLLRLEYRGYDSAGLCTVSGKTLNLRRAAGRIDQLAERVAAEPAEGTVGIAHTRWATHGRPSEANAHPHVDSRNRVALVHNGIIENHATIRAYLEGQGVEFSSQTDTEAVAQLVGHLYADSGDLVASVRRALQDVEGTFGLALVCLDEPGLLIAARRGSPLIIGVGDAEYIVSSDASAIVEHTSQVVYLQDNELVCISQDGLKLSTIDAVPVHPQVDTLEMSLEETLLICRTLPPGP